MAASGQATAGSLARALERWFAAAARDLPWRRDAKDPERGPYCVWVSEIMLQQTQVATVIPYYDRWMAAFPTAEALAGAPLDAVLARWQGLGYYARCRNLHRAAVEVVSRHGGRLPRDEAALAALPGIGRYTVGAIRSIAFGEAAPLVDGNVARVLCRIDAIEGDPKSPPVQRRLWARAEALVAAAASPGRLNESLMELGATVCTPKSPDCGGCPVRRACRARREAKVDALPSPSPRIRRRREAAACVVASRPVRGRRAAREILLGRRPPDGLLGGTWEPPRLTVEVLEALGARPTGRVRHVFTHLTLDLDVWTVDRPRKKPRAEAGAYDSVAWIPEETLGTVALSTLARKALACAGVETENPSRG
jgi:A/G-specific adenine glycosylase